MQKSKSRFIRLGDFLALAIIGPFLGVLIAKTGVPEKAGLVMVVIFSGSAAAAYRLYIGRKESD
jgi:hypothetical protein